MSSLKLHKFHPHQNSVLLKPKLISRKIEKKFVNFHTVFPREQNFFSTNANCGRKSKKIGQRPRSFFLELRKSPDVSQFGQKDRHGVHFFNFYSTVRKFHDFSIAQILREINFRDSRSAKSAYLTYLEVLNLVFHEFLQFQ